MTKKKILCTGSSGFVGKHLVAKLKKEGYCVVEFDLPNNNLLDDNFDCLDKVDSVIHLAAMKGILQCNENPEKAVQVNILGTVRLLEACYKKDIKNFIYISTWAVNSHNKKMYDITKKAAEEIVLHYIKHKNFPAKILRLATLYGGGMAKEGCINVFIDNAKQNKPAPVIGNGWEVRQFLHIKDCINGILIALDCPSREKPYVITAKEVININDLAIKICGEIKRIKTKEEPENYNVLDASCLERNGWQQKISLDKGIKGMMD